MPLPPPPLPADDLLASYRFDLPPAAIAQEPAPRREDARLLVVGSPPDHRGVRDLPELLAPGDLLVVNDTRVLRARLLAREASGGAAELLLCEPRPDGSWAAMVRPSAHSKPRW